MTLLAASARVTARQDTPAATTELAEKKGKKRKRRQEPSPGRGILLIEGTIMMEETLMFAGTLLVPSRPDRGVELPVGLFPAIGPAAISAVPSSEEEEDEDLKDEEEEVEFEQDDDFDELEDDEDAEGV